jgi:4a-hydroxytetrahydrobiopterin dehydratase
MKRVPLDASMIQEKLANLPGWRYEGGKIVRQFQFKDFVQAFGWMTRVALVAEKLDHHPDWKNVYSRVDVELHTHDAGGITDFDIELAKRMNELT